MAGLKGFDWGEIPHSPREILRAYHLAMVDRRTLHSAQKVAARQSAAATGSSQTGIDVEWREGVAQGIEIRHRSIEVVTQMRFIYLTTGSQRSSDAPMAGFTQASMVFAQKA